MGRTEQRADHLEVAIQKVVKHAEDDAAEGVLRVAHWARGEDVERGARWARVVQAAEMRRAEHVIRDGDLLKGARGVRVVGKFAM